MKLVVDASVALRWYVDSPLSDVAAALLELDQPLIAPDLVVSEITNAVWKLVRAGHLSEEHGLRIVNTAPSAFSTLVDSSRLCGRAFKLAVTLDHPVYDCLYLALAELEQCRLVAADQKFIRKVADTPWQDLVQPLQAGPGDR
jgi:predicted nucleic acid-binding protein